MSKISARFLSNKDQKRIVCAEARSDFIDVLFSFLTLPLGSIVRLMAKQSGLGSLDVLYDAVEQLDVKILQTEACKEMLLNPRSPTAIICEDLKIKNIHNANPRSFYICNESDCLAHPTCYYTYVKNCRCIYCGKLITNSWVWLKETFGDGGIFVDDKTSFMISDDLRVMPTSLMRGYSLLEEWPINDVRSLEERVIDFGTDEMLNLLRRSLVSKNPLTEVCFADATVAADVDCSLMVKEETSDDKTVGAIALKLIINKKNNSVVCAEVGEDFVNQLLSFLTFPLGSVLKLISDNISILGGCISNLYSSAEIMDLECFKSKTHKNMLLNPKLATFHSFDRQILKLEETTSKKLLVSGGCPKCYSDNKHKPCVPAPCKHGVRQSQILEQNPKSGKLSAHSGGAFVADSRRFMVSDNLHISPLSFISAIKNYTKDLPISDLVEKDVYIGKAKVLSLLSTMLISKTVLSDVFRSKLVQS
ncbi:uncharacterized protein LOC110022740 [Phalaenopsis equestris]|uniref:uncharacterized protein LOC110022740 n=1 Tax=Phalaenopsis equestris TaxID=78828 RepID=UPI0009E5B59B|nr:uncharacterized protein LOC110022740 [Phalaenopsis equestris]XP_020577476.1 uncharacterized protein LOC110022740 [Phalaenopsis equestris]XP_020577477.1 uncharacterized protein LOC110022740 [Phalaenopsis equestris]XP_020577478.1 uncharacterized protein LOC110022740 [Phalaenopsis equestris]XP_020577479.1 uncharacterized protein LOC110022740 [Phalaenopsis equestris]XP_020577480.1 uncharacterized protein LOC110022740 [Phalaenopsis equestris]XP_020577482.1 uncharacterized protein LOC110022740 [